MKLRGGGVLGQRELWTALIGVQLFAGVAQASDVPFGVVTEAAVEGEAHGARVTSVRLGSLADLAEVKPGDLLLALNGYPIESDKDIAALLERLEAKAPLQLVALRAGQRVVLKGEMPPALPVLPAKTPAAAEITAAPIHSPAPIKKRAPRRPAASSSETAREPTAPPEEVRAPLSLGVTVGFGEQFAGWGGAFSFFLLGRGVGFELWGGGGIRFNATAGLGLSPGGVLGARFLVGGAHNAFLGVSYGHVGDQGATPLFGISSTIGYEMLLQNGFILISGVGLTFNPPELSEKVVPAVTVGMGYRFGF